MPRYKGAVEESWREVVRYPMSEADEIEMFPPRVGDILREAREAKGLSLDEIASRTRVPSRHLATIESGDLGRLPAAPYSAGFIKSYARELGLDEAKLSRAFRDELAAHGDTRAASMTIAPADPSRVAPRTLAWTAALIAVLLAVGYAVWRNAIGDDAETRAQLAAQTEPQGALPGVPMTSPPRAPTASIIHGPPAATPAGQVVLTALQPVWLRVYERDGDKTLYMGQLEQGQRYEVPTNAVAPLIRTGRAESIKVTVGGSDAPLLGPPATILRDVSLKANDLFGRRSEARSPTRAQTRQRPDREAAPDAAPTASMPAATDNMAAAPQSQNAPRPVATPPNNHP